MAPKTTKKAPTKKTAKPATEQPVLVTTLHRGVFFGYATKTDGETVRLTRARNVVYWSSANKGFLGLAANGPASGSKIGPAAPAIELRNITSVSDCSAEAAARFEAAPWS